MSEIKGQLKNYYEILEVSPNSTLRDIERAYQRLALKWHPDKHTADRKLAEKKFQQISEAFDALSDPNKRSMYDDMLNKKWSLDNAFKTFDQFFGQNEMMDEEQERFFEQHFPDKKKNYYKILGVNKNASQKQIDQAYRKMALKYHPKNNPNNEQVQKKFIELNEAYQMLSSKSQRSTYDDLAFGDIIPRRAHDIFQDFFHNKWMDFPDQVELFEPIYSRRSKLMDRFDNIWNTGRSLLNRKPDSQLDSIREGESYIRQQRYEKKNGQQNHEAQTTRRKIRNGQVEQEVLKQKILPNGQRDVTRTLKKGDKVDTRNYHLKNGQNLPKEIANY